MESYIDFLARHWVLSTVAAVLIVLLVSNELSRRLQKFKTLDPAEVARKAGRDGVALIDVREDNEWKAGHIKGARHIPLGKLEKKLGDIKGEGPDEVVLYCRSGNRSATAANILVKGGFENVSHLGGGILAWEGQNYPVSKGR
ncbi:rhodanese-like domain-containing protein [Guyparkeria halophila]|uniref:Rhodanese-like domain-containing protein n=1 Tax=Guyparkeria halophila TaxID=47960 RepID=A0ABZ0YZ73_9GAMM|nr:rhodanese-like domain-containing protein [Guyparkeria halophila]WQH16460.1 rhodanese-like domain-containing protein [Guyparkeria halophila]